jgi:hypothetical protein
MAYGFSINLEFKSETNDLANKIKELLSDNYNESLILNETLLDEELEEGNVIFFGDNENEWRHPYYDEVIEKLKKISNDYNGVFVGTFEWNFYEDDSIKRFIFSENGDIIEKSIEN